MEISAGKVAVVTVFAELSEPTESIQFAVCHDVSRLRPVSVDVNATDVSRLHNATGPSFLNIPVVGDHVEYFIVVDFPRPSDEVLRPGIRSLVNIRYELAPGARGGDAVLRFCADVIAAFSDEEGNETFPDTTDGSVTVVGDGPPPEVVPFRRGDMNQDDSLNISDMVFILIYLFQGEPTLCEKAGDADDDGEVAINDAIFIANRLFFSGDLIPAPFPACGSDPSEDGLTCEAFATCSE